MINYRHLYHSFFILIIFFSYSTSTFAICDDPNRNFCLPEDPLEDEPNPDDLTPPQDPINPNPPRTLMAIDGYVDLHGHLMGEHQFGGSWFWGHADGPEDWSLRRCKGNFLDNSHAAVFVPGIAEFIGSYNGLTSGDTGLHLGKRRGFDRRQCRRVFGINIPGTCPKEHYEHWPSWDSLAHQQMWHGWLKDAFNGGLKVMMVPLGESNFLCSLTPSGKRKYNCNEMDSVIRQVQFLKDFANNHSDWVGIATSPAHARTLNYDGKLVLVMSVEISKLFPHGDINQQLDQFYTLGIRAIQPVHHHNNRFGGVAPIKKIN